MGGLSSETAAAMTNVMDSKIVSKEFRAFYIYLSFVVLFSVGKPWVLSEGSHQQALS